VLVTGEVRAAPMMKAHKHKDIRRAMVAGACISVTSALSFGLLFISEPGSILSRIGSFWFGLGLPGDIAGGVFAAILEHNSHGGGSLLDYLVIIIPANFSFYSLVSFVVIKIASKIRGNREPLAGATANRD
jgi:hypothetical protein